MLFVNYISVNLRKTKNEEGKQRENKKQTTTLTSVIMLKVNNISMQMKRQTLAEWIKKMPPNYLLSIRNSL